MDDPNWKGNVAELEIALAAERAGVAVYKPIAEHGRADLMFGSDVPPWCSTDF